MENKNEQRKQLEEKLIAKATKDETFRKNLLTSPRETLETELGINIPDAVNINVLEEDQKLVLSRSSPSNQSRNRR